MELDERQKSDGGKEIVSFRLGEEEFGVEIMSVREIRGWSKATPLPHSPPYVRGVINLRGAVLPVIDLNQRFGEAPSDPSSRHVVIVVQVENAQFGLLVDAVSDILHVTQEDLQDTPDVATGEARAFIRHLVALDDRMIRLIALESIFTPMTAEAA